MTTLLLDKFSSPIGTLLLVTSNDRLYALDYAGYEPRMTALLAARYDDFQLKETHGSRDLRDCLQAYLFGDFRALDYIRVEPGGTPFQQQVWSALRTIPAGTVMTYSQLAQKLARPRAARAVGAANALNPIAIVTPCHRLVGARGALTGYAGGLERKRWLLQHEGVDVSALGSEEAKEKYRRATNRLYTSERSL